MTDAKMAAANTHRLSRVVLSTVPRDDRMTCSSHGLALGLIKTRCLRDFSYLARLISMHDLADHSVPPTCSGFRSESWRSGRRRPGFGRLSTGRRRLYE